MKIKSQKIAKTFLMILGIVTILSAPISARGLLTEKEKQEVHERMHGVIDRMDLSQDQKDQMKAMRKKIHSSFKKIKKSDLSREDKQKKMRKIRKSSRKNLKSILSDEQYQEYKEKKREVMRKVICG